MIQATSLRVVFAEKTYPARYDEQFRSLGATYRYDERYPPLYNYASGQHTKRGSEFARYYFNSEGKEIGYVIVDLAERIPTFLVRTFTTPLEFGECLIHYIPFKYRL